MRIDAHDMRRRLIAMGIAPDRVDEFLIYHREHLTIWAEFEAMALEMAAAGKWKWSAHAIFNVIRWERLRAKQKDFAVNNNFEPFYPRVFTIKHPDLAHLFELRELKEAA